MSDRRELEGLTQEEREILEYLLAQEASGPEGIERQQVREGLPLSFAQERLWVVDQLSPDSAAYNVPLDVSLEGQLQVQALRQTLTEIVRRHESLRTNFVVVGELPTQRIQESAKPIVRHVDLSGLPSDRVEETADVLSSEVNARPFDLGSDVLFRATLLRLNDEKHRAVTTLHHVASDGWSLGVLSRELGALYELWSGGSPSPLPELSAQYADYAVWHRSLLDDGTLAEQTRYWEGQLDGGTDPLELPSDRPRPAHPTFAGGLHTFSVGVELTERLEAVGRAEDATLFMTLMAAFQILLHRYTGSSDFCVGTDVANRGHPDTEAMIGFFVNQLVLRADFSGSPTVREVVGRVRQTSLDAFANQDLPFEQLVKAVNPDRERGLTPLFQVKLVLNNTPMQAAELRGLTIRPMEADVGGAKFDLLFNVVRNAEGLRVALEYSRDLFDDATAVRMGQHFKHVLQGIAEAPGKPLSALRLLSDAERQADDAFNETSVDAPVVGLADRFESTVRDHPDALAIVTAAGSLTYTALNDRANAVAYELRRRGVGPESRVGLYLERSVEMIVGLIATVKAGAAYVPLDPSYPADRLRFILEDAAPSVVLTAPGFTSELLEGVATLDLASVDPVGPGFVNPVRSEVHPESLVYVIYTSGSTGRPKGTLLTERGVSNYLAWASDFYRVGASGPVVLHSPLGFDLTVTSLWAPLISGQSVVVLDADVALDDLGPTLARYPSQSLLKVTPSHLTVLEQQLSPAEIDGLADVLIVGGEQLTAEAVALWRRETRIINEYGPTETVVGCCVHEMGPQPYSGAVPIGRPIANTRLDVVDVYDDATPAGVPGELLIGGAGVARGYLDRPALTAARFVPDPASHGGRRYRTGDRVRKGNEHGLEFMGRIDLQVKLRGYRIELGEIEAVMTEVPGVSQAVAQLVAGDRSDTLTAWVEGSVESEDVLGHLQAALPAYMVPSRVVVLDELPLTVNGKIDRDALLTLDVAEEVSPSSAKPESEIERTIAAVWVDFLELEDVGLHDNFFELGGDSILSLQIVARLIGEGLALTSQQLFEHPTIAGLAALLDEGSEEAGGDEPPPIESVDRSGALPLSFAQERLWFLDQLEPGQSVYNIPAAVRMRGPLRHGALQDTFAEIVRRHEVLRTTFATGSTGPEQRVGVAAPFSLPVMDASAVPASDMEALCVRLAIEEAARPFDLTTGPLMRATLVRISDVEHVVLFAMHHVVSDGWSMGILVDELSEVYATASGGQPSGLPELEVQYGDFAAWQRDWFEGERLDAQVDYWRETLAEAPPALDLPTDRPRPPVQTFRGARTPFFIGKDVADALNALNRQAGTTLYMSLLAAFQLLLHQWTGRRDILVGSPIAGREQAQTQALIGFFVNTLVMRGQLRPDSTFRTLLEETQEAAAGAFANQDLPFEKLVDELAVERDLSRSPLFQVMFVFENTPERSWSSSEVTIEPVVADVGISKFDLMLDMSEVNSGLKAAFEFNTDLFDSETIDRLIRHFEHLLERVVVAPDTAIAALALLPREERRTLLVEWNDTEVEYPSEGPIHRLVEQRALEEPDAVAVVREDRTLSYQALNERANRLARHLRAEGVGAESRVALFMDRSESVIVSILAILKAGGTYVPLDPEYPEERVAFILADGGAGVVVTERRLVQRLPESDARVVAVDELDEVLPDYSGANLADWTRPDALSHVIYTSGSTGIPKGVAIEHRSVVSLVQWSREHYSDAELDGVMASTSVCFDLSLWEFFVPLSWGGSVVIAENALELPKLPGRDRVTLVNTVPSAIAELVRQDAIAPSVSVVNLAGEPLTTQLADSIYATGGVDRVCDLYGPSEDTTYSTYAQREPGGVATIGKPVANTRAYLLGDSVEPAPIAVPGELHLSGEGLARGYLDRPGLTAERFVPDRFAVEPGMRSYRTGDLVRWMRSGTLEYLGRIDHQVKIRGFRIELGEIQSVLEANERVEDALVSALDDGRGGQRLVAYVTGPDGPPDADALRADLQVRLPSYMVPAVFVGLEAFPLTPNGKIDRSKLPAPGESHSETKGGRATNPVEEALVGIWREVLGIEDVGIHDNFFQLGGDSILSIQIVSRARAEGLGLTPRDLFERQTIAELARVASLMQSDADQGPVVGSVRTTPIQRWFLDAEPVDAHHFNQAVLLTVATKVDPDALRVAANSVVAHHDALRHRFRQVEGAWLQEGTELLDDERTVVVRRLDESDFEGELEVALEELHTSLDLEHGPVFKVGLFEAGNERRLSIVAHHLVVDGVSWRIILDDLQSAYAAALEGRAPELQRKTASYAAWAEAMEELRQGVASEEAYWRETVASASVDVPVDGNAGLNQVANMSVLARTLDEATTEALLRDVHEAYRAGVDDVLLAAFGQALGQWSGGPVLVDVEGHGRDSVPGVDVTRTVGWFTSLAPVALAARVDGESVGSHLLSVKEARRSVPGGGVGYGLLRTDPGSTLYAQPDAPVSFNYLGRFDQAIAADSVFAFAPESSGPARSPNAPRTHLLDATAVVAGGVMRLAMQYAEGVHDSETVEGLIDAWAAEVRAIAEHCGSDEAGGRTPSDFPLLEIDRAALDLVLADDRRLEDLYPLSPMQSGLLFHTLSDPDSGVYFEQFTCVIEGDLDAAAFRRAWQGIVDRHAALRSSVRIEHTPEPLQAVHARVELPWTEHDWRQRNAAEQASALAQLLEDDRALGFDVTAPPLMRIALIRLSDERVQFIWSHHHLLLDGWSIPIILREVLALYEGFAAGREVELGGPPSYREHIRWIRAQDLDAAREHWQEVLAGFDSPTVLGTAPVSSSTRGHDSVGTELSATLSQSLRDFSRTHQVTLNSLWQGAWSLLLARYSGDEDVVFGSTVSGRPAELSGVEDMVGLFINTIPVRSRVPGAEVVLPWLQANQEAQVTSRDFEYSPLGEVQSWSAVPDGTPLFESIVVFENYPVDEELRDASELKVVDASVAEQTNFPLTVVVVPGSSFIVRIDYDTDRYSAEVVGGMLTHLERTLEQFVRAPDRRLSDIRLVDDAEHERMVRAWNETRRELPQHFAHQRIVQQAEMNPDGIAVSDRSGNLSWAELDRRSATVAAGLRKRGVGQESLVGVCMERSLELAISLLGVLRAGGAFLPLDPTSPDERLRFVASDSRPQLILVDPETQARVEQLDSGADVLGVDALTEDQSVAITPAHLSPESPAYVIYTSGSTGRPKGTVVHHGGLTNYLEWCSERYEIGEGAGAQVHSSIGFDLTITSLLAPLYTGTRVEMVQGGRGVGTLVSHVSRNPGSSFLKVTPSHLELLSQTLPRTEAHAVTRALVLGGEALPATATTFWTTHASSTRVFNEYGPTETVVGCAVHEVDPERVYVGTVPIGRPVANTQLYVVDVHLESSPVGVSGELLIGGRQVTRGYLGRPGLTAERFVPAPYPEEPGARVYRTGDLAWWDEDGELSFVGRRDNQVKVRGHRIELGEIEAVLVEHPDVAECSVVVQKSPAGSDRLVGYVTGRGTTPGSEELRSHMTEKLPEYMVPALFVVLDALPLAASGKVDRRALPEPEEARPDLEEAYAAPSTDTEAALAQIWSDVLGVDRVGVHDNYFGLGGDSILAMQIVVRANAAGIVLTPRQLFEHQTVAQLATAASASVAVHAEQGSVFGPTPLSPIQRWFLSQTATDPHHYNQSVLLQAREGLDVRALQKAVNAIIDHHDALRLRFELVENGWVQTGLETDSVEVEYVDLEELSSADRAAELERHAERLQASLDLAHGPLVRVAYFNLGGSWPARLLIVVHHLLIDGVSWRVLLDDLQSAYAAARSRDAVTLPPKTTSFAHWASSAAELASELSSGPEPAYWEGVLAQDVSQLPRDREGGENLVETRETTSVVLTVEETEALLRDVPNAYRTQINDVLLGALASSMRGWTGEKEILVDLEGHGRDVPLDDVDLSRTIGWFTSIYPVRVRWDEAAGIGAALSEVKEQLRSVPSNGLGYSLLYLGLESEAEAARPRPEVSFNYLGQFDQALGADSAFAVASESTGATQSGRAQRTHVLDITALVSEGRLRVTFQYSAALHRASTVESLADGYAESLRRIIEHCLSPDAGGATPSDFPLAELDQETLDRLLGNLD